MKPRILILMAAVTTIVVMWIVVACRTTQNYNVKKAVIENDAIVLNAVTLSQSDEAAMNQILKQYDKSLYRVETYDKAHRTMTRGSLDKMWIENEVASKAVERAKQEGFSQYAVQITGVGHHPTPAPGAMSGVGHGPTPAPGAISGVGHGPPSPSPSATVNGVPHRADQQSRAKNSDEFLQRLKPILEKYAR